MVNGAQTLVSEVFLDPQDDAQLFNLSNFAYYCSFLYTAG